MTNPYEFVDFTKNSDIQTQLIKEFPTGVFTADNSFATPFAITDGDPYGDNFEAISGTLNIPVSLTDVDDVAFLMNAYAPPPGYDLATVTFTGSAGAVESFTLVNGVNVRDFNNSGGYANTINGTSTQNAFTVKGVQDGSGSGNVSTGGFGNYVVDEVNFALSPAFATQTLTSIQITSLGNGTPILLGVTAETASGPPPSLTAPATQTVFADTPTVLGPVSVTDPNAGNGLLTAIVSDATGDLSATASGSGTVSGNGSTKLTLVGDSADLNAELASLEYVGATLGTDPSAAPASDQVSVTVTDNQGQSTSGTIAVTIDQVPETTPTLTAPSTEVYIPGVETNQTGVSVYDPFDAAIGGIGTLTISAPGADLYANGVGGSVVGEGSDDLEIIGTPQVINEYLGDSWAVGGLFAGALLITIGYIAYTTLAAKNATISDSPAGPTGSSNGGMGNPTGGTQGHADITTFDGGSYSFNPQGEFILAKSTVPGDTFEVEARYAPWDNSTTGSTTIGIAAMVGTDRVTFQVGGTDLLMVNGQVTALSEPNEVLNLPGGGGQVIELSPNNFKVIWNTGEQMVVNQNFESTGPYLDSFITLAPNAQPGSVQGLLGTDSGTANDLTLPNGTVLQQPLSTTQLYDQFGAAWRIPVGTQGLFDYPTGENTNNFTDTNFPFNVVTLSDFPTAIVQQAESLATAAGLTNPTLIDNAALNYIVTGDPSFITSAANEANLGLSPTADQVTPSAPTVPLVGISANDTGVIVSGSGPTDVTFSVYLTNKATSDVSVQYAVIAPTAAELSASAFGGTLPTGTLTIAAGQTAATLTIDLAPGVLATAPSGVLDLQLSNPSGPAGVAVVAPTAQTTIINNTPEPGALAVAAIGLESGDGATLTQTSTGLVLGLGTFTLNESAVTMLSVSNTAAPGADDLSGTASESGAGFSLAGSALPLIAAGGAFDGLDVLPDTSAPGTYTGTITLSLEDLNLTGFAAALPAQTITVTDTVLSTVAISASDASNTVATTDEQTANPFTAVSITDENANQTETATVSLGAANGTLSDVLGGTVSAGVYSVSGSAATVAADLDALVFTPTAHQAAPGSAISTTVTADISDTAGETTQLSTTVTATAVNDKPVISGTKAGQTTNDTAAVTPFATAAISDVGTGVEDALIILVTNSSGVATDADGTLSGGGITETSPGLYSITAESPASLTTALQSLVFTPSREEVTGTSTVTTNFALTAVQQGAGGAVVTTTDTTTSLTVTQPLVFLGPSGGFGTIEGTSQPALIQAFGYVNTIDANGGNDSITTGIGNATVYTDGGSDSITLGGFFNTVSGGDGTQGIYAVSADNGNDTVLGGSGNNTVVLGNGNDTVEIGGSGNLVNLGNGNDTIDLTGSNNTVNLGSPTGTDTIILSTNSGGAEKVTGGNGNFSVTVDGPGDTVTLGAGNNLIFALQGMAFITTGAGNDTITLGGSGSTVNAGGGNNFINGGTGDDTFVLPIAGAGFDFIANFTTGNGDMLDLIPALAATTWNGQAGSLANYVQVADAGGSAVISILPTGSGASVGIAVLEGAGNLGIKDLLPNFRT